MNPPAPISRVAVDIGGTFTDLCLVTDDGSVQQSKVLTTENPADGCLLLLDRMLKQLPGDQSIREVIHATTVATNAILESQTARLLGHYPNHLRSDIVPRLKQLLVNRFIASS